MCAYSTAVLTLSGAAWGLRVRSNVSLRSDSGHAKFSGKGFFLSPRTDAEITDRAERMADMFSAYVVALDAC